MKDRDHIANVVYAHREKLRSIPSSICTVAELCREAEVDFTSSGEWPEHFNHGVSWALLQLIEASADELYRIIATAIGEDDGELALEDRDLDHPAQ